MNSIPATDISTTHQLIFNDRLGAAVTALFAALVLLIVIESARHWWLYALRRRAPVLSEAPMELSKISA
jgi:hypothetical protein